MGELRREGPMVGVDAVIGIDLDYQGLTGGGKGGMIMVVATGTAVRLKMRLKQMRSTKQLNQIALRITMKLVQIRLEQKL